MIQHEIVEHTSAAPTVVILQREPLQEDQRAQQVRILHGMRGRFFFDALPQVLNRGLECLLQIRRVRIRWTRFINQAAGHRAIGLNHRFQCLTSVTIHGLALFHRPRERVAQDQN